MTYEEIIKLLADGLRLEVKTQSVYTGSSTGPMYEDCKTVQLVFMGNVISEVDV